MREQLRGSPHNSLPLPTAGWVVEGVEKGPVPLPPPGQGYEAEEAKHMEMSHCFLLVMDLQDSVDPEVFLEEWSECTVQRWV